MFAAVSALAVVLSGSAMPATAQDTTTVNVSNAVVSAGQVSVAGSIDFGDDLTGPITVGTDPAGDAAAPMAGLDMTELSIQTNVATRAVTFRLELADALPTGTNAPASGFQIPIRIDGEDRNQWLGAGSAVSGGWGFSATPWVGVCITVVAPPGEGGGWNCSDRRQGGISGGTVTWVVPPFVPQGGTINHGTVIDQGGIQCGFTPCSFVWPTGIITANVVNADTMFWDAYQVPGKVELGITPAGFPPAYTATGALAFPFTGGFSGTLDAPSGPGEYTVHVRTCGGVVANPTCAAGTLDLTIE